AEIGMVVEKAQCMGHGADPAHVVGDDLALPFRVEKVPIGFELFGIDQLGIVGVLAAVHVALENKNILALGIGVVMFALPPLRFVDDLGKNQLRPDRFEDIGLEINLDRRDHAVNEQIDEI